MRIVAAAVLALLLRGTAALPIDDHAAREWQRRGVSFNVPPPTFARDDFRWTLRQADGADGTVLKHDPETGQWVPVDDN